MAEKPATPEVPGYRIVRSLGEGGMGAVFEAEKLSTHETFALKVIREPLMEDESYVIRFRREVDALCRIRHANVVNVFEWYLPDGKSRGRPFVVMEMLEGESLDARLKREPVVPTTMAVQIVLQVLEGLAAAHDAGLVHRDLGPSNIFLERRASGKVRAKIVDFGLARVVAGGDPGRGVTQEGTILGKPAYAPPELFFSQPLDHRADIFACGMVLYRMLTGRFPFKAKDPQMLWVERWADRESAEPYPSPREFVPDLPEALARVVLRAIQKRPEDRYQSAKKMQRDLLAVEQVLLDEAPTIAEAVLEVAAEPGSSTVGGRAKPARLRPRRSLPVVLGALAAGTALIALALILTLRGGHEPGSESSGAASTRTAATGLAGSHPGAPQSEPGTDGSTGPPGAAGSPAAAAAGMGTAKPSVPAEATGPDGGEPVPPAKPSTVRIVVSGLPPGASAHVGETLVPPDGTVELGRSETPVVVKVDVPGGQFEPFVREIVPLEDQTVLVGVLPAATGRSLDASVPRERAADAGAPMRREDVPRPAAADRPREARDGGSASAAAASPDAATGTRTGRGGTLFFTEWGDAQ
ncbi:MAG: protein kinase [Myxococcota bacterium]|nr:protein kinase [Myxococcota bacterium]